MWSNNLQRCGRIRRLGSAHSVVRIHNYATVGSVFEKKFNRILSKKAIIRQVVEKSGNEEDAINEATRLMEEEIMKDIAARKNK